MKKILCLILIFTLLFCVSCNVADGGDILSDPPSESTPLTPESSSSKESGSSLEENLPPEESSSNLEESLQSEESNNVPPEDSSDKTEEPEGASGQGEIATPTFERYEEYLKFIDSVKNLPDDFITYDMLKDIGEFRSFVCGTTFIGYGYNFTDENNVRILAKIYPLPNEVETYPMVTPDNSSNMRSVTPIGTWSTYSYNNITYHYYFNGTLAGIEWIIGEKIVYLSMLEPNTFAAYPLDGETTFVSQLLSLQTAEAAVEVFNQKVEAEIAKNIADKQSKG